MAQNQRLPKEKALLGAPNGKPIAPAGQVGQGHVAGLTHKAVPQPGPIHKEEEAAVLAGLPQVRQLRQAVQRPILRGLGEIDHPRLHHVLPEWHPASGSHRPGGPPVL